MNGWWKVRLFITMPFIHQALGFNERKWQWKAASSSCWWIDPFFISLEAAHCQHQHLIDYLIHILGIAEKLRMSQACDSKMDQNECVSNSVLSSVSWWRWRRQEKERKRIQDLVFPWTHILDWRSLQHCSLEREGNTIHKAMLSWEFVHHIPIHWKQDEKNIILCHRDLASIWMRSSAKTFHLFSWSLQSRHVKEI